MADLRPCTGCLRHVRIDETRCPFCEAALPAAAPVPMISEARIGRAARMALGAAMATASLTGCTRSGSDADTTTPTPIAAESSKALSQPTTTAAPPPPTLVAPPPTVAPNPFLATGAPSPATTDTGVPPATTTAPPNTAKPLVTTTVRTNPTTTATVVHPRDWGGHAKPYGAPPADGLLRVV